MVQDVEDKFIECCNETGGVGHLPLKLAHQLFLYAVLLMRDKTSKKVDLRYFHVVEDLALFNEFPWGMVAFNHLVWAMNNNFKNYLGPKAADVHATNRVTLSGWGLIYALQVWAYEVIPQFGSHIAMCVEDADNLWPRILRWNASKSFSSSQISLILDLEVGQFGILSRIIPSELENNLPYFDADCVKHNDKIKGEGFKDGDAEGFKDGDAEGCEEGNASGNEEAENQYCSCCVRHEKVISKYEQLLARAEKRASSDVDKDKVFPNERYDVSSSSGVQSEEKIAGNAMLVFATQCQSHQTSQDDHEETVTKAMHDRKRKFITSATTTSPYPEAPKKKVRRQTAAICDPKWPLDLVNEYKRWFNVSGDEPEIVRTAWGTEVEKITFKRIWTPMWLFDQDVDVLINLLMYKAQKWHTAYRSRWTCTEYIFWVKINSTNFEDGLPSLSKFVSGHLPQIGGTAWHLVDVVFGVAHTRGDHWVTYELEINKCCITVYDSLLSGRGWRQTKKDFKLMTIRLPKLLEVNNVW